VRVTFIAAEAFLVRRLCRALQVSRAAFNAWQGRPPTSRARADAPAGLAHQADERAIVGRFGRAPTILMIPRRWLMLTRHSVAHDTLRILCKILHGS